MPIDYFELNEFYWEEYENLSHHFMVTMTVGKIAWGKKAKMHEINTSNLASVFVAPRVHKNPVLSELESFKYYLSNTLFKVVLIQCKITAYGSWKFQLFSGKCIKI